MKQSYKSFVKTMFVMIFVSSITSLIVPIMFSYWSFKNQPISSKALVIILVVMLLSIGIEILLSVFREVFSREYNKNNFFSVLDKFLNLKYDYIIEQGCPNLMERMVMYVNNIYTYMTGDYINILSTTVITVSILVISAIHNIKVFLVLLLMLPINYFGYSILRKKLAEKSKELQTVSATNWQAVLSIMNQTDYIKQLGDYKNIKGKVEPLVKEVYTTMSKVNIVAQSASTLLRGVNTLAQTIVMILIIFGYINNKGSAFVIVLMSLLIPMYFANLKTITSLGLNKRNLNASVDFFDNCNEFFEQTGSKELSSVENIELNIKNLSMNDKILSSDIFGKFVKGDVVWVKGKSGAGKSTLLKLIPKFRTMDGVSINGIDIRDYDTPSLRNKVCYLSQEVPIINGTLRDNLFLNLDYDAQIEEKMSKDIMMSSILKNKNFDSVIDAKGSNLSGGEKQKIAILRGIYDKNEVLILDEITSSIDQESSIEIYNRLLELRDDKIIFIISHDDTPATMANKIIDL
ncbi:MAG: ATP-binding cassette domain-containing protein [Filifactoraceae bacterium]